MTGTSTPTPSLDLLALMKPLVEHEQGLLLAPVREAAERLRAMIETLVAEAAIRAGNAALAAVVVRAGGAAPEQGTADQLAIDETIRALDFAHQALVTRASESTDRATLPEVARAESASGTSPKFPPIVVVVDAPEVKTVAAVAVSRPPVDAATRTRCNALVDEANALFDGDDYEHHELRLLPLTQAIVAEIRAMLQLVDGRGSGADPARGDEDLSRRLHGVLRTFTSRKKRDLPYGYVCGLSYKDAVDSTIDWSSIASRCRARVRTFDEDAAAAPASTPPVVRRTPEPVNKAPALEPVPPPAWPALRSATKDGVVLVIGNAKSHKERETDARERLGLGDGIEWVNVDNDKNAARKIDSLATRVAGNGVVAVVLLEGFVDHRLTKKIEAACDCAAYPVPIAYGGRGGRREFQEALTTLDRKLGNLAFFGKENISEDVIVVDTSRAKIAKVVR